MTLKEMFDLQPAGTDEYDGVSNENMLSPIMYVKFRVSDPPVLAMPVTMHLKIKVNST
jgi:hypothetical protein